MDKITALKQTIYNVENDIYRYNWAHYNTCNCGVVARTLLNGQLAGDCGFLESPQTNHIYSAFTAQSYCITTNLPLPKVFKVLKETEFSIEELDSLEQLSNPNILNRVDKNGYFGRSDKKSLIKYLKAWVEILEEQQPQIEQPKATYPDITKQLAVLPTEEKTDITTTNIHA